MFLKQIEPQIVSRLEQHGFVPLGWFDEQGRAALLIGNVGSSLWSEFSNSAEFEDGRTDPLDRWTQAIVTPLADEFGAEVRYPFGKDLWPFQDYAKRATGMRQSPIGLLIHPEYGLWLAFRAVLIFDFLYQESGDVARDHPCDNCADRPCVSACPVAAFSVEGFDYRACRRHLATDEGEVCIKSGCLARRSCPIGSQWSYEETHQSFHMRAFA